MGKGYYTEVHVTDYGPYVTKLILPLGSKVKEGLGTDTFSVFNERRSRHGEIMRLPLNWLQRDQKEPSMGYVQVTDAYASDLDGNRKDEGDCISLELAYGPMNPITAEISAPEGFNIYVVSTWHITQVKDFMTESGKVSGLVFDHKYGTRCADDQMFRESESHYKELPLRYGYFVPQGKLEKKPLIIWLHGAGEGGFETRIAYTGNKVTCMVTDEIQSIFDGAYLFVPQCPTMWMDDGSHEYGNSGKSMYTQALKAAIDEFVDNNPGIDRNRIYIGGDSNGGFMTMRMCIDYPDFFAAAFPVCEALWDEAITDAQIDALAHLPIWFVHAKNDPVVVPDKYAKATYERLVKAGAENLHFSFFDRIVDQHMGWKTADGQPYEYVGHFAWIPLFNRDCNFDFDGKEVVIGGKVCDVYDWLALQKRTL